mgnify:CR=1 FL=1
MDDDKTLEKATSLALRYLSFRARSEAEMKAYLRRQHPGPVVEAVTLRLKEQGLVDDAAFAHAWSQSRVSFRPRSASLIRRELRAKGVDRDTAQAAVEALDDDEIAYAAGLRAAASLADADYGTFRRQLWGFLQRRGFGLALTRKTVHRLWEEGRSGTGD